MAHAGVPLHGGVGIYAFYALDSRTCWSSTATRTLTLVAELVAAIVAGAQILGGLAAPAIHRRFRRRTSALIAMAALSALALALAGVYESFWAVIGLIVVWGLMFAASRPIRQAYMNGLILAPARHDPLVRLADELDRRRLSAAVLEAAAGVWGYASSYALGGAISALAIPCLALSGGRTPRRHVESPGAEPAAEPA